MGSHFGHLAAILFLVGNNFPVNANNVFGIALLAGIGLFQNFIACFNHPVAERKRISSFLRCGFDVLYTGVLATLCARRLADFVAINRWLEAIVYLHRAIPDARYI